MARPTWHLAGAMALVATLITPSVSAQSELVREEARGEARGGDPWLDESSLDLDDVQLAQLQGMRSEMNDDLGPIREEIQALKEELEQAWSSEYPDQETILHLNEWLLFMDTLIRERHYDFRFEALEFLTDWQREEMAFMSADGEEHQNKRNQEGMAPRYGRLLRQLELDEFQQGPVFDLVDGLQYSTAAAREMLEELEEELDSTWAAEQPDEDLIYVIDEDMDTLRLVILEQEVDFYITLHELLDPDQGELLSHMMTRERRRGPRADDGSESSTVELP